ncbi:MAG: phosphoribosyl-AMP cyclohydrolase [Pseudomonadota bacterium]|nr:phosphoribosyl-AMP cyclohydrolase [Pseudomonadota bacterium]
MMKENNSTIKEVIQSLKFNTEGLIPAIAQQHDTGEVLMMAWMNKESIEASFVEDRVVYWSRSRQALWRKGETSGQTQHLKEIRWDCDGDTLLLQVEQEGVACHTGRRNCFFTAMRDGKIKTISTPEIDPNRFNN